MIILPRTYATVPHNAFITMELTVNILNLLVQCNLNLIVPADFLNL